MVRHWFYACALLCLIHVGLPSSLFTCRTMLPFYSLKSCGKTLLSEAFYSFFLSQIRCSSSRSSPFSPTWAFFRNVLAKEHIRRIFKQISITAMTARVSVSQQSAPVNPNDADKDLYFDWTCGKLLILLREPLWRWDHIRCCVARGGPINKDDFIKRALGFQHHQ